LVGRWVGWLVGFDGSIAGSRVVTFRGLGARVASSKVAAARRRRVSPPHLVEDPADVAPVDVGRLGRDPRARPRALRDGEGGLRSEGGGRREDSEVSTGRGFEARDPPPLCLTGWCSEEGSL